jgi:hypothetical protein
MSRSHFLRSSTLAACLVFAALLAEPAHAAMTVAGTWDDQLLKSATITVTGATPGNEVRIVIMSAGGIEKSNLRKKVADLAGAATITIPTRFIPLANPPGTFDYANGDQICVIDRPAAAGPPFPAIVARARGSLAQNGGVVNQGKCAGPQEKAEAFVSGGGAELNDCGVCEGFHDIPGTSPIALAALIALLGGAGLIVACRRLARG